MVTLLTWPFTCSGALGTGRKINSLQTLFSQHFISTAQLNLLITSLSPILLLKDSRWILPVSSLFSTPQSSTRLRMESLVMVSGSDIFCIGSIQPTYWYSSVYIRWIRTLRFCRHTVGYSNLRLRGWKKASQTCQDSSKQFWGGGIHETEDRIADNVAGEWRIWLVW